MNPQTPTDECLLLIRGTHWNAALSPDELQRVMTDFYAWVDGRGEGDGRHLKTTPPTL